MITKAGIPAKKSKRFIYEQKLKKQQKELEDNELTLHGPVKYFNPKEIKEYEQNLLKKT